MQWKTVVIISKIILPVLVSRVLRNMISWYTDIWFVFMVLFHIVSSYIAITKLFTIIWYIPSSQQIVMIILDQDLFSIEVILNISDILRHLTPSDEDGLRIELSRMLEFFPGGYSKWLALPTKDSLEREFFLGEKLFPPSEGAIN